MSNTFIITSENVRRNCLNALLDAPIGSEVNIGPKRKTPPQRRYWHLILGITADAYGDDVERLKYLIKKNVLGVDKWRDQKGNLQERVLSSEELTAKDYSKLIDYTKIVAGHLNCRLPDPSFYGLE